MKNAQGHCIVILRSSKPALKCPCEAVPGTPQKGCGDLAVFREGEVLGIGFRIYVCMYIKDVYTYIYNIYIYIYLYAYIYVGFRVSVLGLGFSVDPGSSGIRGFK